MNISIKGCRGNSHHASKLQLHAEQPLAPLHVHPNSRPEYDLASASASGKDMSRRRGPLRWRRSQNRRLGDDVSGGPLSRAQ